MSMPQVSADSVTASGGGRPGAALSEPRSPLPSDDAVNVAGSRGFGGGTLSTAKKPPKSASFAVVNSVDRSSKGKVRSCRSHHVYISPHNHSYR